MKTEFVNLIAEDGAILHGLYFEPDKKTNAAVVHLHGLAGNFYENAFISEMATTYTNHGIAFLSFNNRGHDYISDIAVEEGRSRDDFKGGGAYERFSDCILDLDTALNLMKERGISKICLQGHSSGCNKAVFALSQKKYDEVVCVALLSPCDDIGIMQSFLGEKFKEGLEQARNLVGSDQSETLVDADKALYPMCARTYLDYYEDGSDQDVFPYRDAEASFDAMNCVRVPVFVTFGTKGDYINDTPEKTFEILHAKVASNNQITTKAIDGASHSYAEKEEVLLTELITWMKVTFI